MMQPNNTGQKAINLFCKLSKSNHWYNRTDRDISNLYTSLVQKDVIDPRKDYFRGSSSLIQSNLLTIHWK